VIYAYLGTNTGGKENGDKESQRTVSNDQDGRGKGRMGTAVRIEDLRKSPSFLKGRVGEKRASLVNLFSSASECGLSDG